MNKPSATLRIVALCIAAACVYGVAHDLVTAHVCVEYFTVGHPRVFDTDDPTTLALGWGVIATWWVGLLLGLLLAFAALRGRRQVRTARSLVAPVGKLLVVMAAIATVAGFLGHQLGKAGLVVLLEPLASRVAAARQPAFLGVLWAHSASYLAGAVGGFCLMRAIWRCRQRA